MLANNHVRKTSSTCPTQIVQPTQKDAKSLSSSSSEKEKKEHDKGSRNNEQHSINSLTKASCKELEGSCGADISKHTTDHRKTDNHQKNQNHMQEQPCNSSKSSAIGNQTIATLAKKKTTEVVPIAAACSIPNARPLTPPLPPSPPSSNFDATLNIDTFAKTDNSPSSFSSKNNKTSHNTELSSQTSVVSAAACNSMLQKPPLERVVGNDNNTATPKTAHEKCKNIATKTENTFKVSKEGVSAESSSSLSAPEKSQFTCESDQIKKNQDTEVTKHLRPDEHTKKLNSEKQGLACGSSSGQESVESQQKNTQLTNGDLVYKQKKQTAKTLQDKNKSGSKCNNVLENLKTKTSIKDTKKSFSQNHFETHINGETQPQNSEVNKLINDATNSIIEKTCTDEIDSKRRKLDETAADNSIQKGHDTITNGNTQKTRKRLLIGEEFYASENQNSEPLSDHNSESEKTVSNENSLSNLNSETFVNGKKPLTSRPNSTLAITEVVNVPKTTCELSETLASYQAKFGPIPTIIAEGSQEENYSEHLKDRSSPENLLEDTKSVKSTIQVSVTTNTPSNTKENSVQQPSITSPVTVRGIPLSLVEEESAEISRRIAQGLHEKRSVVTEQIDIPSISTVPSDLSQISGTIIVQAANSAGDVVLYSPTNGDIILNDCNIQPASSGGGIQSLITSQPIPIVDEHNLQLEIIDANSSTINLLSPTTTTTSVQNHIGDIISTKVVGNNSLGVVQYENLIHPTSTAEGAINVDESVVGSMIALDSDVHVLNGHHVTTSPQLISTQSPQIDMTTLLSSSQPSSAIPVTTIVSSSPLLSAVAAVKNEPEDLTGQRRDSSNNNNNNSTISSNNNPSDPSNGALLATTNDAIHVNATPFTHESDHGSFTNSVVATGSGGTEFATFADAGRTIYATDPYREPTELYANSGPPPHDFGAPLPRSTSDIQYVQYHYTKSGGAIQPPPGANGNGGPISSPDSGIGDNHGHVVEGFDPNYPHADILSDIGRKPWSDYRQNEEKIHIPKTFSQYGFKYTFEAATSSSQRKEDDKITYINKGQFYGITLEYIADPAEPPLKNQMVKSVIMLIFREGKTQEEELKAWQFWHSRQHSVKQRILDADTKNSIGLIGCIDEISHNALAVYWNPYDSPAKVNLAVQCLSTDFSTQKGVKGLPLHIQIDTYEDPREPSAPVYHRGYCQIKIFCDKGAERKARDEERRATKRRMTTTGKRRLDEMYHTATERSEFYTMANKDRPPILFTPTEDPEKAALEFGTELPSFYNRPSPPPTSLTPGPTNTMLKLNGAPGDGDTAASMLSSLPPPITESKNSQYTPFQYKVDVQQDAKPEVYLPTDYKVSTLNRDAHELIPVPVINDPPQQPKLTQLSLSSSQHYMSVGVPAGINIAGGGIVTNAPHIPDPIHGLNPHHPQPPIKRVKVWPSKTEQIMIYVRQDTENAYTALHVKPPTVQGLLMAIESKYKINARNIRFLYRCNSDNITAKIDDEMLRSYCNEDAYLMQVMVTGDGDSENNCYDITFTERAFTQT